MIIEVLNFQFFGMAVSSFRGLGLTLPAMLSILLYGLLIWFLYTLIFRFIIPIYRTTRQVKQKFREMRQTMQEQMNRPDRAAKSPEPEKSTSPKPGGDYIEFEEVK